MFLLERNGTEAVFISSLLNNGRLVGAEMRLTQEDVICCPPLLFHCFGLLLSFLGSLTHNSTIVFPSDQFEQGLVLDPIDQEKCTALLGVPTKFIAELKANKTRKYNIRSLRMGLTAWSPMPSPLIK